MTNLLQDFRFSLRLLRKSPGFTALAVLTLALALGVNSAIFSLVNGLILRPLIPLRPAEVVSVYTARQNSNHDYRQFNHADYLALRGSSEAFRDVTAVNFNLAGIGRDHEPMRRSFIFEVPDNFFSFMGVQPAAGRFFTAEECRPNANLPVVVASHSLWQRLGGRPDFVGSTLRVNGRPHTIVGVAPEGFSGISALIAPEVWLPLGLHTQINSAIINPGVATDLNDPKNYTLNVMARLSPGLTLDSAKLRLPALATRLAALSPEAGDPRELQLTQPSRLSVSTSPSSDSDVGLFGVLLISMASIVLLIASLNLANMLLARGSARAREIAVRLAVGATRGQIIRQLLVEGLTLALLGGVAGLLLSFWTNSLLEHSFTTLLGSMNFSLAARLQPDFTVLGVTFLFCLLATLLFSFGPALQATRRDLVHDLKAQAGEPALTGRWNRFFAPRHLLVMAQMTLSLVLIFSAGLFLRGAIKAGGLDKGFQPDGVVLAEVDYSLANTPRAEGLRRMSAVLEGIRRVPGVQAAGLSTLIPYGNVSNGAQLIPADQPVVKQPDPKAAPPGTGTLISASTSGFLDSIGVRILRGRDFTATESLFPGAPAVALVDEGLAKALFPDKDPLGQRIRYTQPPTDGSPAEMEIIGIVSRHRHDLQDGNGLEPTRRLFVPLAQSYNPGVFLSVRGAGRDAAATASLLSAVRMELRHLDPDLPLLQLLPFTTLLEKSITLWGVRLGAILFGVFGGIALILAVVGIYGVKAYTVERRTREIGIRIALGADHGNVFSLIMRQGAWQIAVATAVGVVLSLLLGRVLSSMLFQVSASDPLALGVSILTLAGAALVACYVPARRATRVNPLTALRSE